MVMSNPASLPPGFRFHPTDEELILHYLRKRTASTPCPVSIIAEVDIYKFDPWELPEKALFGDREWYFFSPRDRKYPNGVRPNRAAASGYWKATGTDKPIQMSKGSENIGVKKALVFYKGRPPKGLKTNWIMHEYRLAEAQNRNTYRPMKFKDSSMRLDDWVLCRIYKKSSHLPLVQPAMDQDQDDSVSDDMYSSGFHDVVQVQQSSARLPKSSSISEFFDDYSSLSHLFDNMPEMPALEHGSTSAQPSLSQLFVDNNNSSSGNNNFVQQFTQIGSSASIDEHYSKRQRISENYSEDGNNGPLHPSKNQFDGLQLQQSLLSQTFSNQQMLLNPNLGMH